MKTMTYSDTNNTIEKISVITVVYNDAKNIQRTIDSCLVQSWPSVEYIIIDGGSKDGTSEIVAQNASRLAYWSSEPDKGIFDAMNKGVSHATGDWICFLNSGDEFATPHALEDMLCLSSHEDVDVLYANSIAVSSGSSQQKMAGKDPRKLDMYPVYRHGSSLVRSAVQREFGFDLDAIPQVGYGLDWEMIHRMFVAGCRFQYVECFMEKYEVEGTSNHQIRNRWNNYKITSGGKFSATKFAYFILSCLIYWLNASGIYRWARGFFMEWMVNSFFAHIPFWWIRKQYLKLVRAKIGRGSMIMKSVYIMSPNRLRVGEGSHVNYGCILDARAGIEIGNSVSISHRVNIMTGGHDFRSRNFAGVFKSIVIEDYAWLGVGCTILQGVHIGRGAVVCAGAVVNRDVPMGAVVAGIPAKQIAERPSDLDYKCVWTIPFC